MFIPGCFGQFSSLEFQCPVSTLICGTWMDRLLFNSGNRTSKGDCRRVETPCMLSLKFGEVLLVIQARCHFQPWFLAMHPRPTRNQTRSKPSLVRTMLTHPLTTTWTLPTCFRCWTATTILLELHKLTTSLPNWSRASPKLPPHLHIQGWITVQKLEPQWQVILG